MPDSAGMMSTVVAKPIAQRPLSRRQDQTETGSGTSLSPLRASRKRKASCDLLPTPPVSEGLADISVRADTLEWHQYEFRGLIKAIVDLDLEVPERCHQEYLVDLLAIPWLGCRSMMTDESKFSSYPIELLLKKEGASEEWLDHVGWRI